MSVKGRLRPVPLKHLPIITEPFTRVAVDFVVPLSPLTSEEHCYILTLIDFSTGFPEAEAVTQGYHFPLCGRSLAIHIFQGGYSP